VLRREAAVLTAKLTAILLDNWQPSANVSGSKLTIFHLVRTFPTLADGRNAFFKPSAVVGRRSSEFALIRCVNR
jgi:hypothetical protein